MFVNGYSEEKSYIDNEMTKYENFVSSHSYQLLSSAIPEIFWRSLSLKLQNQIYDAGENFQIFQSISGDDCNPSWQVNVISEKGITPSDPKCIFLIDHAWSYRATEARASLNEHEGLLERMCKLMNISYEESKSDSLIGEVIEKMWEYNCHYSLGGNTAEIKHTPIWYIMDEFGSRIQHDGEPNCRIVPFFYIPTNICYSLLFPIKGISTGEEVTRNYVEIPPVDTLNRDAQMLPWFLEDLSHIDPIQDEPSQEFFEYNGSERIFTKYCGFRRSGYMDVTPDTSLLSEREQETLPNDDFSVLPLPCDRKIKVFADYEYVQKFLTDERFEFTIHQEEADILWVSSHFKRYDKLSEAPWKRINQFPCEHLITTKDILAIVSRRRIPSNNNLKEEGSICHPWALQSFCLKRELPKFVSKFQRNEKSGLDNIWIIKPWNLARGLDHTVSNNLNHIIRLSETGPKIAQRYLTNPVLFHRDDIMAKVKFDLRFIVMLLNVNPLKVAVYKNFWIRFANKSFNLDNFEDYQKHFTVNNYNNSFLLQMTCDNFIEKFENQYPLHLWSDIQRKIYQMIKEVFQCATIYDAPKGIPNNPQCRAYYGLDIMLDWTNGDGGEPMIQPKLLEINFIPDCKRACEYYPNFYNDIFRVMFLDDDMCSSIKIL